MKLKCLICANEFQNSSFILTIVQWQLGKFTSAIISDGLFQWKPDVYQRQGNDFLSLILGATKQR